MQLNIGLGLALLWPLLAGCSGADVSETDPAGEQATLPSPPAEWQAVDSKCGIGFKAPTDIAPRNADPDGAHPCAIGHHTSGCALWGYQKEADQLTEYGSKPNFQEVFTNVDGRKAKLITYDEPRIDGDGRRFRAGIHFARIWGAKGFFTMTASCNATEGQETMKALFGSIEFAQERPAY